MSTLYADHITDLRAAPYTLHKQPSKDMLQQELRRAEYKYTATGSEANGDDIVLETEFPLPDCALFPELCRVRASASVTGLTHKLQKVNPAGTATDLTGALAFSGSTATAYVGTAGAQVRWDRGDKLRILITSGPTITAGIIVTLDLVYTSNGR